MKKIRVGLFFGGIDQERHVSHQSAYTVRRNLDTEKYQILDIEILPGELFMIDSLVVGFESIVSRIDVAMLALHGSFGEDGTLQKMLDKHGIAYTGSDALSSSVAFSKVLTKQVFERFSIKTPAYVVTSADECANTDLCLKKAQELFTTFPQPCVIKPSSAGSSLGISLCATAQEIAHGLAIASEISNTIVVEEYITGKEATVGVIDEFRDQDVYALPPVEIIPPSDKDLFDLESKYNGTTREICPARFDGAITRDLSNIAAKVHTSLQLKDYSRTDFIIHPTRGIFALEVNTLPGLSAESLFPKELAAVGVSMKEFLNHIIERNIRI